MKRALLALAALAAAGWIEVPPPDDPIVGLHVLPAYQTGRHEAILGELGDSVFAEGVETERLEVLFDVYYDRSGVDRLRSSSAASDLTVGAGTLALVACYEGTDATTAAWIPCDGVATAGSTLAEAGASTPTVGAGGPFLASTATSVHFATGSTSYYAASNNTFADFTNQDFVVEFVGRVRPSGAVVKILSKSDAAAGYEVYTSSGNVILRVHDAGDADMVTSTASATGGGWAHTMWFAEQAAPANTSLATITNGTALASVATAAIGSYTLAAPLTLGALSDGTSPLDNGVIGTIRIWSCSGCLTNADLSDETALAKRRFYALTGTLADRSVGSAVPTIATRASVATSTVYDSATGVTSMYNTYNNWPRLSSLNLTGASGYFAEAAITNKAQSTGNISATWTPLDAGDSIGAAFADPLDDGSSEFKTLTGDATDGAHGVTQLTVATTAAVWTYSIFVTASGATPAAWTYLYDSTPANCNAYFNLTTCAAGTLGAGVSRAHTTDYGGTPKVCRLGITCTMTAAGQTIGVRMADADADNTTANKTQGYWGAQVELVANPTSYVASAAGTSARVVDVLAHTSTSNAELPGTLVAEGYFFDYATSFSGLANLSDSSGDEAITLYGSVGTDFPACSNRDGAAEMFGASGIIGATTATNGAAHTIACSVRTDTSQAWLDGVSMGTDAASTMPTITSIYSGVGNGTVYRHNGFVKRVTTYPASATGITR